MSNQLIASIDVGRFQGSARARMAGTRPNSEHVQNLPNSWGTLYELTNEDGTIHAEMERREALGLHDERDRRLWAQDAQYPREKSPPAPPPVPKQRSVTSTSL